MESAEQTHLLLTKLNEDLEWLIENKRIDRAIELEDSRRRVRQLENDLEVRKQEEKENEENL